MEEKTSSIFLPTSSKDYSSILFFYETAFPYK